MIYVSESHMNYWPLPHPGNFSNSCQLILRKERGKNKKGWECVCVFSLTQTLQKFSKGIFIHSTTGTDVKFSWRSVSGPGNLGEFYFYSAHQASPYNPCSQFLSVKNLPGKLFRRTSMPWRLDEEQQDITK